MTVLRCAALALAFSLSLAGVAAAITDAVYHATGVRVRKLPVMIEDLLGERSDARRDG